MAHIKVDGDRWKVRLGQEQPRPGSRLILFFCEPTGQRPYRVVEVPEERFKSQDDVERLSRAELIELYRRSSSMDIPTYRSDEIADVRRKPAG
jgi:hypothetical protein